MVGFGKFVSVLTLVLCVLSLIGGIGAISDSHGEIQDLMLVATIVSVALLSGLATVVWNVATIVELARRRSSTEVDQPQKAHLV